MLTHPSLLRSGTGPARCLAAMAFLLAASCGITSALNFVPSDIGLTCTHTIQTDWGTGYQGQLKIKNTTGAAIDWSVTMVDFPDTITSLWGAAWTQTGDDILLEGFETYRNLIPKNNTFTIGYVAERTGGGTSTASGVADFLVYVTSDWKTGYMGRIKVTNAGTAPIIWSFELPIADTLTSMWGGTFQPSTTTPLAVTVTGNPYNSVLKPGQSINVGFVARRDVLVPDCYDGADNDGDGLADYIAGGGGDPDCAWLFDPSEAPGNEPQCHDGIDNDGDGFTDYPADSDCDSPDDLTEGNADLESMATFVEWRKSSDWGTGYYGKILVRNDSTHPITDWWTIMDDFPHQVTSVWGAPFEQDLAGRTLTIHALYGMPTLKPGQQIWIGFAARTSIPGVPACNDLLDNDGDGLFDLDDPGCIDALDNSELDTAPLSDQDVTLSIQYDWGTGYQARVVVKNTSPDLPLEWAVDLDLADPPTGSGDVVTSLWNGIWEQDNDELTVIGTPWNGLLAPGKSTTFSFVAKRPELPGNVITTPAFSSVPAGVVVTTQITAQWGGEFLNLQVNVTNNGPAAAEWEVTFDLSHHVVQSYWSAAIAATAPNSVTFKGQSWNKELNPGQSTSFGLALKQIP